MNQDLSIITLILHASLVVQLVMAGLMAVSLASWTVIFGKFFGLKRVRQGNDDFERDFWSGRSLTDLQQASASKPATSPLERIFASGMREFMKLRERRLDGAAQLDGARRAMRASYQRELDVTVQLTDTGRASLRLQQQAWRRTELLAEGGIRIGCVAADGAAGFRPCRIPAAILETLR